MGPRTYRCNRLCEKRRGIVGLISRMVSHALHSNVTKKEATLPVASQFQYLTDM
jgi:hypothetical protein